jgi:hypothetical protein
MKTNYSGGPIPCSNTICDPNCMNVQEYSLNISAVQPGIHETMYPVNGEKSEHSLPNLAVKLSKRQREWSSPVGKLKPKHRPTRFNVVITYPSGRKNVIGSFHSSQQKYAIAACERYLRTAKHIDFVPASDASVTKGTGSTDIKEPRKYQAFSKYADNSSEGIALQRQRESIKMPEQRHSANQSVHIDGKYERRFELNPSSNAIPCCSTTRVPEAGVLV